MKNVFIYAPVRTGRSMVAKKLREKFEGNIMVLDEFFTGAKPNCAGRIVVCMGYADSTPEKEHAFEDGKFSIEDCAGLIEQSKLIKSQAEKHGWKYFDVSDNRGDMKFLDSIVEYILKEAKVPAAPCN